MSARPDETVLPGIPEGGFDAIVELYGGPSLAFAMNVLGNKEDAEDAVQESFVQVYRNLGRYDRGRSFKTWLFTIVCRRCLDMLKKRKRLRAAFSKARYELPVTSNPGPGGDLPSGLLDVLSPRERTALTLWADEGYTAEEIGGILAITGNAARVTLFKARRKIKALLEDRHASLQNG